MLLRYTVVRRLIVYRKLLICDKERKKIPPLENCVLLDPCPRFPSEFPLPSVRLGGGMDIVWNYTI